MFLHEGDEMVEVHSTVDGAWQSRWRVESLLANGRHFRHYLVVNLASEMHEHHAVLKTIKYDPRRCDDSRYISLLRSRLTHQCETLTHFSPRLPEVVDFFEVENRQDPFGGFGAAQLRAREPVLVQTRLHGLSLAELMSRHGAPPGPADLVLLVVAKVCTFLEELHAGGRGWLFSGLTPEHILLEPGGYEPFFVGCSNFRMLSGGRAAAAAAGDPAVVPPEAGYTAPERLSGGSCDVREDVYAVGALLFHLFTGLDPRGLAEELGPLGPDPGPSAVMDFAHEMSRSMERVCRRNLKGLGIHRARVRKVLLRAVSPDPADRHGSPAELRDELVETLARSMPALRVRFGRPL